jgi:signal transduction histidine kinase
VTGLDRGLHAALAALRFGLLAWLGVVTVVQRDDIGRPALAWFLVGVTLAWSIFAALVPRPVPAGDLAVSAVLLVADRHVYDGPHAQTFGGAWPLVGAIAAGLSWGPMGGAAGGALLGLARWAGSDDAAVISLVSSAVFYVLAGAVAGYVVERLRRAESEVAAAEAREHVARRLHDGVLQILAVVQRRSGDAELSRLAREQERELREWLFGAGAAARGAAATDLPAALRAVAARVEDRHGLRADVVTAASDDGPALGPEIVAAVAGAVGEALTNAAKHGNARHATVYAQCEAGATFVSVKDDGCGFDPAATTEGIGITRSIRARLAEAGGRVEIDANPGHGTEVRLWVE